MYRNTCGYFRIAATALRTVVKFAVHLWAARLEKGPGCSESVGISDSSVHDELYVDLPSTCEPSLEILVSPAAGSCLGSLPILNTNL